MVCVVLYSVRVHRALPIERLYGLRCVPGNSKESPGLFGPSKKHRMREPDHQEVLDLWTWEGPCRARHVGTRTRSAVACLEVRRIDESTVAYHYEFTTLQGARAFAYTNPVVWVTWKELMAGTLDHSNNITVSRVFAWPIHPLCTHTCATYLCHHSKADTAGYEVAYHGSGAPEMQSIVRHGFRIPTHITNLAGPAVYLAPCAKAGRFAAMMSDFTPRKDGVIARVLVDTRGARHTRMAIPRPVQEACQCERCVRGRANNKLYTRVADHLGTWRRKGDILTIPPGRFTSKAVEWAVSDPRRLIVLSYARAVQEKSSKEQVVTRMIPWPMTSPVVEGVPT